MRRVWFVFLVLAMFAATGRVRSVVADNAEDGVATGEEDSTVGKVEGGPTGEHADGHAHDYSQPPLNFEPQLFVWTLVLFLLFLAVSRKVAWKPLIAGLNAREDRVNRALAEARSARDQAERLVHEYDQRMAAAHDEVRGIVANARREAEQSRAQIIAAAESDAEQIRDRAVADIARARERLLAEIAATADQHVERTSNRLLEGMRA
jgi:F-type H+-transporting ATPase subunit b